VPPVTEISKDGDWIKMDLEVVENSWEGSASSVVSLGNGSAVSTPRQQRSSGANARPVARVYDVKLDSGELQLA
jgi:hypothetical protein